VNPDSCTAQLSKGPPTSRCGLLSLIRTSSRTRNARKRMASNPNKTPRRSVTPEARWQRLPVPHGQLPKHTLHIAPAAERMGFADFWARLGLDCGGRRAKPPRLDRHFPERLVRFPIATRIPEYGMRGYRDHELSRSPTFRPLYRTKNQHNGIPSRFVI